MNFEMEVLDIFKVYGSVKSVAIEIAQTDGWGGKPMTEWEWRNISTDLLAIRRILKDGLDLNLFPRKDFRVEHLLYMRVFDSLAYSPKELEKWKLDHEKWHKDIVDKFPPKVDQYKKALKYVDRAIIVKKNDMYSNEKIARDLKLSEITIERIVTEINFMKLEELEELREMLLGKECRHDSTENERRILEYRKSR